MTRSSLFKLLLIQFLHDAGTADDPAVFKSIAASLNAHPLLKKAHEPRTSKDVSFRSNVLFNVLWWCPGY